MITAIIIDDEVKGRLSLRKKLQQYCPEVEVIAEAANGTEGMLAIEKLRPQLIFLDIEMPKMNGFEMLTAIQEKNFHIIFTTAYDQYAIKAIKYAAFDYLLKPVDIEELRTSIKKIATLPQSQTALQAEILQQNTRHPKKTFNKLAVPTLQGLLFIDISDIIQLEASSNYTNIYIADQARVTASKTLKEYEDMLPSDIFFRIHHSHIINLNFVKRYVKGEGGQIELKNGNYVDVSRRKKEEFLRAIGHL